MDFKLTFKDGDDGYLAHYGVLGMKWGVRKAESRARVRRAKYGSLTDTKLGSVPNSAKNIGKQRVNGLLEDYVADQKKAQSDVDRAVKDIQERKNEAINEVSPEERTRDVLDYFEKTANKEIADEVDVANALLSLNFGDKVPKIQGEHSFDDDMKIVNTLKGVVGYEDNCACCSAATILRQKGFDVVAGVRGSEGTRVSDQEKWFTGGKFKNVLDEGGGSERSEVRSSYLNSIGGESNVTDWGKADRGVFKSWMLHDEPEGSYGFLGGQYDSRYGNGGHSITYKIEKGDVVCRDGQTGEKYDSFYDATKHFDLHKISYMRVDDKEPDWNYLAAQNVVKYRNDYYD